MRVNPFSNFKSSICWAPSQYERPDAEFDEYGDPIPQGWRKPYVRGSEADCGDFVPVQIGTAFVDAMVVAPHADSPIETILGAAILRVFRDGGRPLRIGSEADTERGLILIPQFRWNIYRSDLAIYNPRSSGAFLIECDGRNFHSSAEQIAHDAIKDAAARASGYPVMRFPGSEINADPTACARRVFDFVYRGRK